MGVIAHWALMVALFLLLVPVCVLSVQLVAGVLPRRIAPVPLVSRPRAAILVPAHDEAGGIEKTVQCLRRQLAEGDRLLVVADNCTDETAAVAARAGAEVVERHDSSRRGKGYALDFGVRHLERDPPEVLVIVDADCEMTMGSVDRVARLCAQTGRPVQALDLMLAPADAGTSTRVGQFAWTVRNQVRPLGCLRLGLPCQLMGTGMGLPWTLARSLPLASAHLVEDMRMGVDCARAGFPPLFCPEALVVSRFPAADGAIRSQRTRWEHGHLAMIASHAPGLLLEGLRGSGRGMLALALDMCVPPLALLTFLVGAMTALAGLLALTVSMHAPLLVSLGELAMLATALALVWWRFGATLLPPSEVLRIFPYLLWKLPIYLQFFVRKQSNWVRSRRNGN
jgi:cellulose synthase/poly-beta-1,6-N-acetylglucosamine synthase-like glycosyltransferase